MERECFKEIGLAIKTERKKAGLTRENLAEMIHVSTRYLIAIENDGQAPSFQVLYLLVRTLNISIDQYIHTDALPAQSTLRRNIYSLLENVSENDLVIIEATITGIINRNKI